MGIKQKRNSPAHLIRLKSQETPHINCWSVKNYISLMSPSEEISGLKATKRVVGMRDKIR